MKSPFSVGDGEAVQVRDLALAFETAEKSFGMGSNFQSRSSGEAGQVGKYVKGSVPLPSLPIRQKVLVEAGGAAAAAPLPANPRGCGTRGLVLAFSLSGLHQGQAEV